MPCQRVSACSNRTYGENCSQQCGQCADLSPCDVTTGHCDACQGNFSMPLCKGGASLLLFLKKYCEDPFSFAVNCNFRHGLRTHAPTHLRTHHHICAPTDIQRPMSTHSRAHDTSNRSMKQKLLQTSCFVLICELLSFSLSLSTFDYSRTFPLVSLILPFLWFSYHVFRVP